MSDASRDAGVRALQQGDAKTALQHLAQAVQQNPQDAQAHAYMGAAYGQLNMPQQAVEALTRATQLAPLSAPIRFNLAVMLEKSGRRDEAVAAYRQVVVLDGGYDRARQALARLGEPVSAPGAPAAPGSAAPAAPGAPPASASPYGTPPPQVSPYGSPPPPASPYGTPPPQVSPYGAPPAQPSPYGAPPPQSSPYGAPPPAVGHPTAAPLGGAPPSMTPPGLVVPPPAPAPPGGMQPLGDWTPPPSAAPPSGGPPGGMQPLGEWSPPPPPAGGLAAGQSAPPPPPRASGPGGATVAVVDHPEMMMSRSHQLGHCYLAGMGMGVWWGLLGAAFVFMRAMTHTMASDLGRMMPLILTMCVMNIALGALIYGLIGLAGGATEDAETACGNFGIALGVLGALLTAFLTVDVFAFVGLPSVVGSIWVSRKLGQSLGMRINEMQSSIFVVAGPSGVAMTSYRKR